VIADRQHAANKLRHTLSTIENKYHGKQWLTTEHSSTPADEAISLPSEHGEQQNQLKQQ
jgi:hypothetical protein